MLQSLIIAFSMYSKIPMPKVEWSEKNRKYCLAFFPFVGAVIGICQLLVWYLMNRLAAEKTMAAVFLTVLPILISGGIHMDGFLDTIDAKSSWKPQEERLKILKDSHAGAFAVIYGGVYLLLTFGLYTELMGSKLPLIAVGYAYERVLSGWSLVTFKKARKDGMAAEAAKASEAKVKWILTAEGALCVGVLLWLNPIYGGLMAITGMCCLGYYRYMAYRYFGGTTGDLAGYFLQICELMMLMAVVFGEKIQLFG